jgi:Ca2+-binding RTX toxin-like protein
MQSDNPRANYTMMIDRSLAASAQTGSMNATSATTVTSVEQQYFGSLAGTPLTVSDKTDLLDRIANYSFWKQTVVTYSFPTEQSPDYIGNNRDGTLRPFTANQIAATHDVIALLEDVMNLDFQFAGNDINADTRFYNSTIDNTAGGAPAGPGTAGDIWVYDYDITPPETRDYTIGRYDYHILLHELGHTMGFSHTGDFTGTTYAEKASYVQDNNAYSMMSYLLPSAAGIEWNQSYDSTPMIQDILGLQHYYGANMTTRTGDTVYGFNSNITDRAPLNFDTMVGSGAKVAAIAIWDAGGHDTIDLSGFIEDAHLDLNEAAFSNAGGKEMVVSIAYGVTVEDGITGEGNDALVGNAVANTLKGGDGSDRIFGGDGDDTLMGDGVSKLQMFDASFDLVQLNAGAAIGQQVSFKNVSFGGQSFTVEFLWKQGALTDQAYSFSLPGFSIYRYDNGNIAIKFWGATENSWVWVGASKMTDQQLHRISLTYDDDTGNMSFYVDGVEEFKTVFAPGTRGLPAAGNVSFKDHGMVGDVRVYDHALTAVEVKNTSLVTLTDTSGATGLLYNLVANATGGLTDTLSQGTSTQTGTPLTVVDVDGFYINRNDHLFGDEGNDRLDGGAGNNELHGGAGDDTFVSRAGFDLVDGGDGIDTVDYAHSALGVTINLALGTGAGGDAENDEFIGIENVVGSATGANTIKGNDAANKLRGGSASDVLDGGLGSDLLQGGAGDDTYILSDADIIEETAGGGIDRVYSSVSMSMFANIENIALTGTAVHAVGNTLANKMYGNATANKLFGGLGNDRISGGEGNDIIVGGDGVDLLIGGVGSDAFYFNTIRESSKTTGGYDYIADFNTGVDRVYLKNIDASSHSAGNNAFKFIGSAAFHKQAGELRYGTSDKTGTSADRTCIAGDVNGDGIADFLVSLKGLHKLTAGDFVL